MPDPEKLAEPADTVLEAVEMKSFGLSQDGKSVRLELSSEEEGGKVFLTLPTEQFPGFYHACGELLMKLRQRKVVPDGGSIPQAPGSWLVGNSNNPTLKEFTALMFDKGQPQEAIYMMADLDAIAFADAIEANIYQKLSPPERAQVDEHRRRHSKPKLILPSGGRMQ